MRTLIQHFMTQARGISATLKNLGLEPPEPVPAAMTGSSKPAASFRKPRKNEACEDEAENEGWPALKTSKRATKRISGASITKQKEKMRIFSLKRAISLMLKLSPKNSTNKDNKSINSRTLKRKPEETIKLNFSDARFTLVKKGEGVRFYKAPYISSVR